MRDPSLGLWLCSLSAFFFIAYAVTVEPLNPDTCSIQAWVRAPDLEPGEIIPGQVKVQIDGPCNPISEYSLVLRFKERIWAKIPKPGVIFPEKPKPRTNHRYSNLSIDERRAERNNVLKVDSFSFGNSPWNEYYKQMKNATLWEIAEEERIAFETRHKLSDGFVPQSKTQTIHDFALLVPTTNYPPSSHDTNVIALQVAGSGKGKAERGHEHIYLYTIEVKFNNGSIIEVPAGLTSFKTVDSNPQILNSDTPRIVSFTANFTQIALMLLKDLENPLNISSDIEITLPHGGHVEQGSILNLTFTSSELQGIPDADRANHTILFSSPSLGLHVESQHRHVETLFPEFNVPTEISPTTHLRCHHFATSNDSEHSSLCYNDDSTGDKCQKQDWSISTSVPLKIPKVILPSFDMYYQSIEAKIWVTLELQYIPTQDLLNNNENDPWIPTMQTSSVEELKYFLIATNNIPIIIHSRTRKPDFQVAHYLSPDARQPIFVDPCMADKLSRLSLKERDTLAPISTPVINKSTDQIVRNRYYSHSLHYVGDTWQRKVLDKGLKVDIGENGQCGFSTPARAQAGFMV